MFIILLSVFFINLLIIDGQHIPIIMTTDQDVKACWQRLEGFHKSCQTQVMNDWEFNSDKLHNFDKIGCCADWDVQDCLVKAAKEVCSDRAAFLLNDQMVELRNFWMLFNKTCSEYPYETDKCRFPVWAIVLIVISLIIIIIIIVPIVRNSCQKQTIVYDQEFSNDD